MKIKTSELKGIALDYAVALAEGGENFRFDTVSTYWITINGKDRALKASWAQSFIPSTNWAQAGEIIEREEIAIMCHHSGAFWDARVNTLPPVYWRGETSLIAAMRCYVASKLGDEVEIPEELVG